MATGAPLRAVLADGLIARGVKPGEARLLGRVSVGCFHEAILCWLNDPNEAAPGLDARARETFAHRLALLVPLTE